MKKNHEKARKQAREARVFVKQAIRAEKGRATGNPVRKKKSVVSDRLFEDKVYLAVLARGVNLKKHQWKPDNSIENKISNEAGEALEVTI